MTAAATGPVARGASCPASATISGTPVGQVRARRLRGRRATGPARCQLGFFSGARWRLARLEGTTAWESMECIVVMSRCSLASLCKLPTPCRDTRAVPRAACSAARRLVCQAASTAPAPSPRPVQRTASFLRQQHRRCLPLSAHGLGADGGNGVPGRVDCRHRGKERGSEGFHPAFTGPPVISKSHLDRRRRAWRGSRGQSVRAACEGDSSMRARGRKGIRRRPMATLGGGEVLERRSRPGATCVASPTYMNERPGNAIGLQKAHQENGSPTTGSIDGRCEQAAAVRPVDAQR